MNSTTTLILLAVVAVIAMGSSKKSHDDLLAQEAEKKRKADAAAQPAQIIDHLVEGGTALLNAANNALTQIGHANAGGGGVSGGDQPGEQDLNVDDPTSDFSPPWEM